MVTKSRDVRHELEEEYRAWARICANKHGLPWPVSDDELPTVSDSDLMAEIKKLKDLGRTPHEG